MKFKTIEAIQRELVALDQRAARVMRHAQDQTITMEEAQRSLHDIKQDVAIVERNKELSRHYMTMTKAERSARHHEKALEAMHADRPYFLDNDLHYEPKPTYLSRSHGARQGVWRWTVDKHNTGRWMCSSCNRPKGGTHRRDCTAEQPQRPYSPKDRDGAYECRVCSWSGAKHMRVARCCPVCGSDTHQRPQGRIVKVRCSSCNITSHADISAPITCPNCGHMADVKPPQRPQPDQLSGTGPLRRCSQNNKRGVTRSCDWVGRESKTRTLTGPGYPIKHCCPKCRAATRRVWRGKAAIEAELSSLGSLDLAPEFKDQYCPQACKSSGQVACEFHSRVSYCKEHGWCEECAAAAADPTSEALKAVLSTPLPEVDSVTDELIEELEARLAEGRWPAPEPWQYEQLFDPPLRWPAPYVLPPNNGNATLITEHLDYPPWMVGLVELPETAEQNYARLTAAARKRRQEADKGYKLDYARNPNAENECLSLGHIEVVGQGRCLRCGLTKKDQELLRAKFLDTAEAY